MASRSPRRTSGAQSPWELAANLGVPTFTLALLLFIGLPRFDRALEHLDRVDATLSVIAASCDVRRLTLPSPP